MIKNSVMAKSFQHIPLSPFLWTALVCCLALAGCSKSHILHTRQAEGGSVLYIDFERNPDPFQLETAGEKDDIQTIKILGFEGDKFLIDVAREKGEVMMRISGDGIDSRHCRTGEYAVMVREGDCLFSVILLTGPGSEYSLRITKL